MEGMHLDKVLKKIYPEIGVNDYSLIDYSDGKGPVILEWNYTKTQPTQEDILSVWLEIESTLPGKTKDTVTLLGEQLVQERIERMKAKQQLDQVGKEIVATKLELMQLKGGTSA
jgi:uncharacterized protein YgiM (DUF1202 family)